MNSIDSTALSFIQLSVPPLHEPFSQRFLRFSLGSTSGLLPLEQLAEVFTVKFVDILPVPEMPECVLGLCSWRGKMLWLVDLNQLVDDPQPYRKLELSTLVVQLNEQFLGLVVPSIDDIEQHDPETLQPIDVGLFPQGLLPFVKGYLPGVNGVVFAPEAIARYPQWQIHRS